jgi:hypothetical protein
MCCPVAGFGLIPWGASEFSAAGDVIRVPLPLVAITPAPLLSTASSTSDGLHGSSSGANSLPVLDVTQLWDPVKTSVDSWVRHCVLIIFQDVAWPSPELLAKMAVSAGNQAYNSSDGAKVGSVTPLSSVAGGIEGIRGALP